MSSSQPHRRVHPFAFCMFVCGAVLVVTGGIVLFTLGSEAKWGAAGLVFVGLMVALIGAITQTGHNERGQSNRS